MIRLLVCGGRSYAAWWKVYRSLNWVHRTEGISVLIHGAASGADSLGGQWARNQGVEEEPYPIVDGEGGYARNRRMLRTSSPDAVMYFPGGNGTRHMRWIGAGADLRMIPGLAPQEGTPDLFK